MPEHDRPIGDCAREVLVVRDERAWRACSASARSSSASSALRCGSTPRVGSSSTSRSGSIDEDGSEGEPLALAAREITRVPGLQSRRARRTECAPSTRAIALTPTRDLLVRALRRQYRPGSCRSIAARPRSSTTPGVGLQQSGGELCDRRLARCRSDLRARRSRHDAARGRRRRRPAGRRDRRTARHANGRPAPLLSLRDGALRGRASAGGDLPATPLPRTAAASKSTRPFSRNSTRSACSSTRRGRCSAITTAMPSPATSSRNDVCGSGVELRGRLVQQAATAVATQAPTPGNALQLAARELGDTGRSASVQRTDGRERMVRPRQDLVRSECRDSPARKPPRVRRA